MSYPLKQVSMAELVEMGPGTFFYDLRRLGAPANIFVTLGVIAGTEGRHGALQYTSVLPWSIPKDDGSTELWIIQITG